jgi:uncharacterized membrane protein YgdD (TMEM256/DUF423 family)
LNKIWTAAGAAFGFLAVALGAFGAHGLEDTLSTEMMETYRTGILYHLIRAVIITTIGIAGNARFKLTVIFFSAGILLFSFSLYFYSITELRLLALITPIGGLFFLIGWLIMVYKAIRN